MMRSTIAVFKNQCNEFRADKEQLLLYIIFPALAFFQIRFFDFGEGVYPYQLAGSVAAMFASTVMILIIPPIIAEHREQGSLRFMVMSGIKPASYLLGIGSCFIALNMLVAVFFAWLGEISGVALLHFFLTLLLGMICSILLGAVIGIASKNRQKAMSLSMPIGVVLIVLPMFAGEIEILQPLTSILYVERVGRMMAAMHSGDFMRDLYVVLANIVVLVAIFVGIFKVKGLKQ